MEIPKHATLEQMLAFLIAEIQDLESRVNGICREFRQNYGVMDSCFNADILNIKDRLDALEHSQAEGGVR